MENGYIIKQADANYSSPNDSYSFNAAWAKDVAQFENGMFCNHTLKDGDGIAYFQYIKRDISDELPFLEKGKWFDIVTPFDYGGFYYTSDLLLKRLLEEIELKFKKENIISGFFRFNPLLKQNYGLLEQSINITKIQEHIYIELDSDYIREFSKSKTRDIKRTKKRNYSFIIDDSIDNFYSVYKESIIRINASIYFLFDKNILENLLSFGKIFSIVYENKVVYSIFVIEDVENIYYFLSAGLTSYLKYPFNALLLDLICEYYKGKKKRFFLGGGKDGLYEYKKNFSLQTVPFFIGKKIFNQDIYDKLTLESKRENNEFFPQYRAKTI